MLTHFEKLACISDAGGGNGFVYQEEMLRLENNCVFHASWPPSPRDGGRCHTGVTRGVGTKRRRHGDYSLFLGEVGVAGVRFFLKESPFRLNL